MTGRHLWLRFRSIAFPRLAERELQEEIAFHVEMQARKHIATGHSTEEAHRLALADFGSTALVGDQVRDEHGIPYLDAFRLNLRHAIRALQHSPNFTLCAVLTLATAIGATTAMFTLANALLFRPLPVPAAERLLSVASMDPGDAIRQARPVNGAMVDQVRAARVFAGVCSFLTPLTTVDIQGTLAGVSAVVASGDCFTTLGVRPALGRLVEPSDDRDGAPNVVAISYDTWQQDFGGRPDILEQRIGVDGAPFRIIGVVERSFPGLLLGFPARVYLPLRQIRLPPDLSYASLGHTMFVRLREGDGVARIKARIETEWPEWLAAAAPATLTGAERERFLKRRPLIASAATGVDYSLRPRFGRPLTSLLAIASLVLLVAAVNVANLLLARAAERRRDTAVRVALGATRRHLAQRLLLEGALVLSVAATAAIFIAYWCDRILVATFQATSPGFALDVTPDRRAFAFTFAAAIAAFLVFAVGPAFRSSDVDITAFQSASGRVTGATNHTRRILLIAQVAVTLVLVAVGSVFGDALSQLRKAPIGVDPDDVIAVQLAERPGGYVNGVGPMPYYRALIDRMRGIPGVASVSLAADPPFGTVPRPVEVGDVTGGSVMVSAEEEIITDHFFETMKIPLLSGSDFQPADVARTSRTVIVSESLARRLFGSANPLGKTIRTGSRPELQRLEIIGIAEDAVLSRPQARNTLIVYQNWWQGPILAPTLMVRTRVGGVSTAAEIRDELRLAGREFPRRIRTVHETLEGSLAQERLLGSLSAAFAGLGLMLAAVGWYGLLAFTVANRTNEIGVRIALGATRRHILRLVASDALATLVAGVVIGIPMAWAAVVGASRVLLDGQPSPVLPILSAIVMLVAIGTIAATVPALRAASVDPVDTLRRD